MALQTHYVSLFAKSPKNHLYSESCHCGFKFLILLLYLAIEKKPLDCKIPLRETLENVIVDTKPLSNSNKYSQIFLTYLKMKENLF